MSKKGLLSPLNIKLIIVFVSMLAMMLIYELTKQVLNPDITLWESHAITIVFTSIVAVVIMFFPLRSTYREQLRSHEALRHQLEAEEKLRRSEAQYRSFVESVEDSIYTVDPDSRYLLINTRHLFRQGISPEVYAGKCYGDFHSPKLTSVFTVLVKRVLESKSPVQDEYEQNGKYYHRKLTPVIDPATNNVIAVTVISSDITERKNAEKTLTTINRKLNLMNDITRHDMLNQLTVLSSYLALAGDQPGTIAVKRYLVKSEQVIDTIHAQICFSRDYQRIGVESPQWQNVSTTIQKARMPLKIASVMIDNQCDGIEIFADLMLEKVFYNLLDNAIRYAGSNPAIRFSVLEEPDGLLLACEDDGNGVPDENKEKIFLKGFGKNSGLGLFLIREILAITGISIHENGMEGTGCRFEIFVPSGSFRRNTLPKHFP
ncbi:MAG: PAS domain-containing protein [Methanoregula sp.]|jgi:PAS domain S-box-containing protein|uniref:sensor histidine kinase n=1 Tax=Methanoregula sp. TaxID=2052170 RepID=UPI0025DCE7E5|nr:ATP-binding protein [Methanoregula sp.]MCK9630817.1 PAS domain-containing protein [Methanoregula sp.]